MVFSKGSLAGQTDFSLQLAHRVALSSLPDSNLAFSPLSIYVALGLLAAGSEGATLQQLTSVLRAGNETDLHRVSSDLAGFILNDGSPSGGPRICFSSGVWVDASLSLKPSFKEKVTSTSKASAKAVDFQPKVWKFWVNAFMRLKSPMKEIATSAYKVEAKAVDFQNKAEEVMSEVNSWVENATAGLIKELLPAGSVNHGTRLVLCNAMYYKGVWVEEFDASKTKESEFHLFNGSSVKVPFMTSNNKQYLTEYDGFKVLRIPYKQGDDRRQFSMYIFLPDAQDGLWNLHEKLSSGSGFLDQHCPLKKVEVGKLRLPKFKISFGFEASDVLKDLGLVLPFTSEGDLAGMVDLPARVSSVFHRSFLEVNEGGTEAAAGTAVVTCVCSAMIDSDADPIDFEADHPFAFVLQEDTTGVVLFVGHVVNPLTA